MNFDEGSGLAFEPEPTCYAIAFSLANNPASKQTSQANTSIMDDGRCKWMDSRQIAVNDTVADKLLNVVLVKLTAGGMDDIVVALGQVPQAKLAEIYTNVEVKQKGFRMDMKNDKGAKVGALKLKITFTKELVNKEG